MFSFRYVPFDDYLQGTWEGEFETAPAALAAGWNKYGDAKAIAVGEATPLTFSELTPDPHHLFSILQELASKRSSDEDAIADAFDELPFIQKAKLHSILVEAIEEWEAELDPDRQFRAVVIKNSRTYWPGEVAR